MTCFSEQNFHFYTRFLVIDQVFLILRIFTVSNVVYDPFFTRKSTISEKNSLTPIFLLCSSFRAHPTTLILKILGGTNAWAFPPPQILGGTVPSVPPRSTPLVVVTMTMPFQF